MRTGSIFFFGLFCSAIGYFAFIFIPNQSSTSILSQSAAQGWILSGRYFNFKGHAIFFKDSATDVFSSLDSLTKNKNPDTRRIADYPILLLVHGFPSFSFDFENVYSRFSASQYHVVAVDLLGFGLSDKPHFDYSVSVQADMLLELVQHICRERLGYVYSLAESGAHPSACSNPRIHVLAHDYGATVAQELIARKLDHLSLVDSPSTHYLDIRSVVLLNGGIFPEMHKPTIMQTLLLSPVFGPLLQMLSTVDTFGKGLAEVFGRNTKPSREMMEMYWAALLYKDGNLILHNLQQYIHE